MRQEAHKTIRILIDETLRSTFKYSGNVPQAVEGILAAIVIIAREFKLNVMEALVIAREEIVASAQKSNPEYIDEIKKILSNLKMIHREIKRA